FVPPVVAGAEEVAAAIAGTVGRAGADKPVLVVVISAEGMPSALRAEDSPIAAFLYPESAAHALGLAAERAEWLRRPAGAGPALEDVDPAAARAVLDEGWLEPAAVRALLAAYGVPLVEERLAADADEAVAAAAELGFPVVVKTAGARAHKTATRGCVAVDARVRVEQRPPAHALKSW